MVPAQRNASKCGGRVPSPGMLAITVRGLRVGLLPSQLRHGGGPLAAIRSGGVVEFPSVHQRPRRLCQVNCISELDRGAAIKLGTLGADGV